VHPAQLVVDQKNAFVRHQKADVSAVADNGVEIIFGFFDR